MTIELVTAEQLRYLRAATEYVKSCFTEQDHGGYYSFNHIPTIEKLPDEVDRLKAEITRLQTALEEAEKRGYDATKEQAARVIDNLAAHLNLEQFLLTLRDKPKAAEIGQSVIAILESASAAIRAMVKP